MRSSLAYLFALLLLSGCLPSSIYLEQPLQLPSQTPAIDLDVAQADFAVPEYALEQLAADLRATRVFRSVRVGSGEGVEALAVTREVFEGPGCGNPLILTMVTLGVVPVTLPRTIHYDFDLTSVTGEALAHFTHRYSTKEKFGLVAVPMRLSRKWAKSPENGTPQPFIQALRADLLSQVE